MVYYSLLPLLQYCSLSIIHIGILYTDKALPVTAKHMEKDKEASSSLLKCSALKRSEIYLTVGKVPFH